MNMTYPLRNKKDIENLKDFLKKRDIRNYLMFMVGISSCLRISDILSLKVNKLWDGKAPNKSVTVKEKKTGKTKTFATSPNLQKAIKEYIRECKPHPDDYVFVSRKGSNKPITRQRAVQILNEACDWCAIKEPFGSHGMRKTFAYWAWKSGTDPIILMRLLNHSSQAELFHYICIEQLEMNDVYINLNL